MDPRNIKSPLFEHLFEKFWVLKDWNRVAYETTKIGHVLEFKGFKNWSNEKNFTGDEICFSNSIHTNIHRLIRYIYLQTKLTLETKKWGFLFFFCKSLEVKSKNVIVLIKFFGQIFTFCCLCWTLLHKCVHTRILGYQDFGWPAWKEFHCSQFLKNTFNNKK